MHSCSLGFVLDTSDLARFWGGTDCPLQPVQLSPYLLGGKGPRYAVPRPDLRSLASFRELIGFANGVDDSAPKMPGRDSCSSPDVTQGAEHR